MSDLLSERMREHLFRVSENEPVTSPEAGWPDEVAALEAKLEAMERALELLKEWAKKGDATTRDAAPRGRFPWHVIPGIKIRYDAAPPQQEGG